MGPSHQLPLVGLLLFSLIPGQPCTICEVSNENYSRLNPLINTMINSKYTRGIQAANVLLSLRLAGIQDQSLGQLTQEVRDDGEKKDLTSGQLALVILALGACQNSVESVTYFHLVSQLEKKFQEEIENMGLHDGNPLTNYYQLSLDVLALCLFNGTYSIDEIKKYFAPENKNFYFGAQFSVDTGAMAVLALTCVKRSMIKTQNKSGEDLQSISNYIESLVKKMLAEKNKENGLIGNIYSTGEAMQALFVSSNHDNKNEWNCQQTLNTVLEEIPKGAFRMPIAAAQILPALMGKTYLDVNNHSSCGSGHFNLSIQEPTPVEPTSPSTWISVHYTVKINKTYSTEVTVPKGSVFLDVMKEAQKIDKAAFRFTYVETSWGPYITSVQGLKENSNDRTYWQLLSGGTPVSQGVGNYVVHNGENLEVRWSKY
ncbi:transcobalamin-1 [Molossus molossus]|uniref:Transcobalamin 1 n=2 Tax=Molossus molossus TaxID=27622 RepID=A0A7J8EUY2_MOLMO|nr:transcobalamin-1 [Molossus molossus]KAF6439206.1 transcobalamin 1 [Molossus molossus]